MPRINYNGKGYDNALAIEKLQFHHQNWKFSKSTLIQWRQLLSYQWNNLE